MGALSLCVRLCLTPFGHADNGFLTFYPAAPRAGHTPIRCRPAILALPPPIAVDSEARQRGQVGRPTALPGFGCPDRRSYRARLLAVRMAATLPSDNSTAAGPGSGTPACSWVMRTL